MNIFTYGSLMFPEVWQRITDLPASGEAAGLNGYAARRIRGQTYPALIAEAGAVTAGVLYRAVTPWAVARLDAFEGGFYERVGVSVTADDGGAVAAWVYLAAVGTAEEILPEAWDAAVFEREHLADFLGRDPGFSESGRA